jgi:hypothetical protein
LGSIEGHFQGEPQHHGCAAVKAKEEGRKGRLIGFSEEDWHYPREVRGGLLISQHCHVDRAF